MVLESEGFSFFFINFHFTLSYPKVTFAFFRWALTLCSFLSGWSITSLTASWLTSYPRSATKRRPTKTKVPAITHWNKCNILGPRSYWLAGLILMIFFREGVGQGMGYWGCKLRGNIVELSKITVYDLGEHIFVQQNFWKLRIINFVAIKKGITVVPLHKTDMSAYYLLHIVLGAGNINYFFIFKILCET